MIYHYKFWHYFLLKRLILFIIVTNQPNVYFLEMPSFIKTPVNVSVRAGRTAKLPCDAVGLPTPQVSYQKDGGDDFPAARQRRLHVMMPRDDVFFIVNVKSEDQGVYSCTASNEAGTIRANATLTVLGK